MSSASACSKKELLGVTLSVMQRLNDFLSSVGEGQIDDQRYDAK